MKNEDEKLNENEQPLESNKSFDSKETNSNWIDTDTYASLQVTETDEKLVNTNKESLKLSAASPSKILISSIILFTPFLGFRRVFKPSFY
jgi:hypothetical protein